MRRVIIGNHKLYNYTLFENGELRRNYQWGGDTLVKPFDKNGYKLITIKQPYGQCKCRVNRLVAAHFKNNPRPDIFDESHHIDSDKSNNHASNLIWVNKSLNQMAREDGKNAFKCWKIPKWKARTCGIKFGFFKTQAEAKKQALLFKKKVWHALYKIATGSEPTCVIFPSLLDNTTECACPEEVVNDYINSQRGKYQPTQTRSARFIHTRSGEACPRDHRADT